MTNLALRGAARNPSLRPLPSTPPAEWIGADTIGRYGDDDRLLFASCGQGADVDMLAMLDTDPEPPRQWRAVA
jgi:hypothetical protein